jgi:hypothetical protein
LRPLSEWKRTAGVLTALVVLALGSSYLGYDRVYEPYHMHSLHAATARAQEAATATHNVQLQATSEAQATATASVLLQFQTNYVLITSTRPAIDDQMHGPNPYKWDTGIGCTFKNKTYSVTITQKSSFIPCIAKNTKLSNFVYQVRMKIIKGDAGGLIFRANATSSKAYLFNIGQDGSYSIYYYPGDAAQTTKTISSGFSDLIATGQGRENLVAVIAKKNSVDLYINKKYLTSFQDSNLTSGQIGIIANDNQNDTEVVCTQIQVWHL